MTRMLRSALLLFALALAPLLSASAQLPLPPSGDNQKARVSQWIGPVEITVDYNSPDVHSPTGEDRTGKIWGQLVPWGMSNLGFGTCGDQCPWRGGANENTTIKVSHDVTVQGKTLGAGTYGLHFLPGADEWTVIFSKNSTSWGSYFYDVKEDALRVTAKPAKGEFREWLTYDFTDRDADHATLELQWENLRLPIEIGVSNIDQLYLAAIRRDLRTAPGFDWKNWQAAAAFCLQKNINLDEALVWAKTGALNPNVGQENFTTLVTLARVEAALGKAEDAKKTYDRAFEHPTAAPVDLHQLGRQLLAEKKPAEAMRVFEANARRFPNVWPTEIGLLRGHAALGNKAEALRHAKIALTQAPDEAAKKNVETLIGQIEKGVAID
jgi:tetratricopeptide (TPR) repeat protein